MPLSCPRGGPPVWLGARARAGSVGLCGPDVEIDSFCTPVIRRNALLGTYSSTWTAFSPHVAFSPYLLLKSYNHHQILFKVFFITHHCWCYSERIFWIKDWNMLCDIGHNFRAWRIWCMCVQTDTHMWQVGFRTSVTIKGPLSFTLGLNRKENF